MTATAEMQVRGRTNESPALIGAVIVSVTTAVSDLADCLSIKGGS